MEPAQQAPSRTGKHAPDSRIGRRRFCGVAQVAWRSVCLGSRDRCGGHGGEWQPGAGTNSRASTRSGHARYRNARNGRPANAGRDSQTLLETPGDYVQFTYRTRCHGYSRGVDARRQRLCHQTFSSRCLPKAPWSECAKISFGRSSLCARCALPQPRPVPAPAASSIRPQSRIDVVAIGSSTGGPNALGRIHSAPSRRIFPCPS